MANEVDYSPQQYNGNGTTKTFSFNWKVFEKTDLIVSLISNGVTTPLTLGTDYQASVEQMGGTVTLAIAPAVGDVLRIERLVSQYQSKRYSTSTGFQGEEIEKSFDRNSCNIQDMQHTIDVFKSDVNTEIGEFENSMDAAMSSLETATLSAISDFENSVNAEITSFETATSSSIASIQSTANTALSNSQSAVTTANTASDNASTALSNSQSAVTTANTANNNASTALSNASTALSNSQSAVTTANSASSTATAASDKVDDLEETIQVVIDAAEQIEELQEAVEEATEAATDAQQAAADAQAAAAAVVIDQTFDGTSTHAQSGAAIAGAGFLSGITSTLVVNALGYTPYNGTTNPNNYISGITSSDVLTALGYTPYNSTNPNNYITGITSSDVTNALDYTPVDKAGDTMSGALSFTKIGGGVIALNAIPESGYSDIQYTRTDGLRVGFVRASNVSATERNLQISVCNNSGSPTSNLILRCNNDVNSCTFPNTTCVDGQWVNTSVQLANNVSLPVGNEQEITYDLSSAIPNDNYKYEVVLNYGVQTGNSSGAGLSANIIGSGDSIWHRICDTYARGSWHMNAGGNVVVTVGTGRTITFKYTTVSKAGQLNYLYVEGYRRIGTNA